LQGDFRHVQAGWFWFVILGAAAITYAEAATTSTAVFFG
jgi:hypothetical protein